MKNFEDMTLKEVKEYCNNQCTCKSCSLFQLNNSDTYECGLKNMYPENWVIPKFKYEVSTWCNYVDYNADCDDISTNILGIKDNLEDAIILANEYVEKNFSNPLPYRMTEDVFRRNVINNRYACIMNDVRTEGERVFIKYIK